MGHQFCGPDCKTNNLNVNQYSKGHVHGQANFKSIKNKVNRPYWLI